MNKSPRRYEARNAAEPNERSQAAAPRHPELSLFWTVNDYAQSLGRARAIHLGQHLDVRPGVVLDSATRLFPTAPGIVETALPSQGSGTYHYRYRGLRLDPIR